MKLSFIGLGLMGLPMASHLLKAKHKVTVWNRTPGKTRPLAKQGAKIAATAADAASQGGIIFLMVGDTPDVKHVLFGKDGVAQGARKGSLVVDCTTISPEAEKEFGRLLLKSGIHYLDAPVTGGQKGALEGTLTFMAGGRRGDLERAKPALRSMGRRIFYAGPLGSGQKLKVVNQMVCGLNLVAMAEGFLAAKKLGLSLKQTRDLLLSGAARSFALDVYGEKVLRNDYSPGFSVKWHTKDLRIALATLKKNKALFPGTILAHRLLSQTARKGWGEEGAHALYKLYLAGQKGL